MITNLAIIGSLTYEEITVLALAVAKGIDPDAKVSNASDASKVVWANHATAGPKLCSLMTMLAEASYGLEAQHDD